MATVAEPMSGHQLAKGWQAVAVTPVPVKMKVVFKMLKWSVSEKPV